MESLEFNKVAGGVLGTLLFVVALTIVTDGLFSTEPPKKPGFDLPSAPTEESAGNQPSEAKEEPLPVLLAKADAAKGKGDTTVCQTCHNFEKGAGPKIGPPLYGVVGRPKGSVAGFAYSDGMKKKGGNWTFADLNAFITKPAGYVEGTKMAYGGEADAKKRAEIIVYLNSLSDHPEPLPKPEQAAGAAASKAAPTKSSEPAGSEKTGAASGPQAKDAQPATAVAKGDPEKGKADVAVCKTCHNFEKGAGAKIGPNLFGVVDREKGSFPGFQYSSGMKSKGGKWTPEDLNQFISKPGEYVPGTKMAYPGEPSAKKRSDIIAYLGSLSEGGAKPEAGAKPAAAK